MNVAMAGEALTLEELHRQMGHVAPETIKRMVSNEIVEGMEADLTMPIQPCASCEYGKATRKPIKKICETPRATKFGDKMHSGVWGPSPVQTPGHKEYYVSFTDDHTQWTYLKLLVLKDEVFEAYKNFEAWARVSQHLKSCIPIEEESTWAKKSPHILHPKVLCGNLPSMTHWNTMVCLNDLTGCSWNEHRHYYTQVSFLKTYGVRLSLMLFG